MMKRTNHESLSNMEQYEMEIKNLSTPSRDDLRRMHDERRHSRERRVDLVIALVGLAVSIIALLVAMLK